MSPVESLPLHQSVEMPGKFENTCDWIYNHTKKAVAVSYNETARVTGKVFSTVDRVSGGKAKDVTGITVATVTTKAAVVPTLGALGFGSSGVVGGTTASWFMSLYGGTIPAGRQPPRAAHVTRRLQSSLELLARRLCLRRVTVSKYGGRCSWVCVPSCSCRG